MTFGARLAMLVEEHPDKAAIIFAPQQGDEVALTWRELDRRSNQVARLLAEYGTAPGSTVVVGVWNTLEHFFVTTGAWKLGALALPLRAILPKRERDQIMVLATPSVVFADWDEVEYPVLRPDELERAWPLSDEPLPDDPPHPGKAIASGGSTGRSKIIVDRTWHPVIYPERSRRLGARYGQVQLMAAPLYHNSPFLAGYGGLADDHTIVLMERFDAAHAVDLIERHGVNYAYLPPIIMRRIAMLPDIQTRDLSSIEAIQSSAAPCPPWLKRFWIELIGPDKVHEVYGSTEGIGATMISGSEWLEHPGSVGRPISCELRVLDEQGIDLPSGEVGEIFMRPLNGVGPTFGYIGAPEAKSTPDGFLSIGDLGWLDDDGYLYIADRRVDLVISGGANVYPAEVEAALSDHPGIADVAVIGVPDEEWGRRVHAIVQPTDPMEPPSVAELDRQCRERLASYKAPKTYEFVAELPRNEAGKIRRSELVDERASGWTPAMIPSRD
ncbi:MAG TPA: AMP-binding protein [Thermomicrobiales bacterium]|nr:AMP-binding protein [Thermomicrobiales bacterium]